MLNFTLITIEKQNLLKKMNFSKEILPRLLWLMKKKLKEIKKLGKRDRVFGSEDDIEPSLKRRKYFTNCPPHKYTHVVFQEKLLLYCEKCGKKEGK